MSIVQEIASIRAQLEVDRPVTERRLKPRSPRRAELESRLRRLMVRQLRAEIRSSRTCRS